MSAVARDVLDYLGWWDGMLWREAHRADPTVEWQADLSWSEIAACVGVEMPPPIEPGEPVANVDLAVALYWPGQPPLWGRSV